METIGIKRSESHVFLPWNWTNIQTLNFNTNLEPLKIMA
jgi:hypothetical protein